MAATRDGKMWCCQFYYKDWQGVSRKNNKRGFKTKSDAEQWKRDFLQQQQKDLNINFENFVQIYYEDMEHCLRENTMRTKKFIIDLKIISYFKKRIWVKSKLRMFVHGKMRWWKRDIHKLIWKRLIINWLQFSIMQFGIMT